MGLFSTIFEKCAILTSNEVICEILKKCFLVSRGVVILIVFIVVRQRNKVDDANVSSNALKPKESG